ncbi:histidine kinase dimerization/phosphoacceptor domain -containing protein [Candidatus Magnetomonas plexicatena]|uniref:histidine kinase dimerization/phosphoacceptor domain -containing protein n=1 Tax=Candidatus Magnetomonas plexicatena TaxID=2552947 RepID=UPI001100F69B|nr:HAMP domain-containing protein [Nitrospirales bacterium LBB_01]
MKIRNKIIIIILLSSILPTSLSGMVVYNLIVNNSMESIRNHLIEAGKVRESMIDLLFDRYTDNIKMIANRKYLKEMIKIYNNTNDEHLKLLNQTALNEITQSVPLLHEVSIYDPNGNIIASTESTKIGNNYKNTDYFVKGINTCGFVDIFRGEDNEPDFHFSCPLTLNGKLLGVVIGVMDGKHIMEIADDYTGLGASGETVIAMRDKDGDALFITPTRHDKKAAFQRKVSRNDTKVLITQALMKKENIFSEFYDYRGVRVLGVTRYIDNMDWGLVIKIDKSEFLKPLIYIRNMMILGYFVLLGVIVGILVFYINRIIKPLSYLKEMIIQISERGVYQKVEICSKDEIGILSQYFNQMVDHLNDVHHKLEDNLNEKTILLKEMHHRVKNNLQIISSLLYLRGDSIKDESTHELIEETCSRIRAIALLHEQLYRSKNLAKIDFYEYVKVLTDDLIYTYGADTANIVITLNIKDILLGIDIAIPCGLIINELVTNALKYAFPSGTGEIVIGVSLGGINMYVLNVSDNGIGISKDINIANTDSFGIRLVNDLVEQQNGKITVEIKDGTVYNIVLYS